MTTGKQVLVVVCACSGLPAPAVKDVRLVFLGGVVLHVRGALRHHARVVVAVMMGLPVPGLVPAVPVSLEPIAPESAQAAL